VLRAEGIPQQWKGEPEKLGRKMMEPEKPERKRWRMPPLGLG
jgi:hypothetical protein